MSVRVGTDALREQIGSFGPQAYLVTVSAEGTPHVVSVLVRLLGDDLAVDVGRTSRANVSANPVVTLLWPSGSGGEYSLIVDGQAEAPEDGEAVTVRPAAAVLHRVAGVAGDGPSCMPVLPRD